MSKKVRFGVLVIRLIILVGAVNFAAIGWFFYEPIGLSYLSASVIGLLGGITLFVLTLFRDRMWRERKLDMSGPRWAGYARWRRFGWTVIADLGVFGYAAFSESKQLPRMSVRRRLATYLSLAAIPIGFCCSLIWTVASLALLESSSQLGSGNALQLARLLSANFAGLSLVSLVMLAPVPQLPIVAPRPRVSRA